MTGTVERVRRPPADPPPELELPEFTVASLDRGPELWIAVRHMVPEVSVRLIVEAGAVGEPSEHAGVAELTGRLLTEGAGERDAVGMADWLDRLGASFRASVGYDVATLGMHFLSEVSEGALDFLAAALREPRFEPHEVDRVRSERLDEIERQKDEPAVVADLRLIEALYGDGPYGRPVAGTEETVREITDEAVREFHADRYTSAGARLIVCGDVEPERWRDLVAARLTRWPDTGKRPEPPEGPEVADGSGVRLVDRPGSPQAEVRVGTVGVPYSTPDLFPVTVANAILGGLFNSRINMNLREDKGWTYGARTYFRLRRGAGPFVARTAVETPMTGGAFREVLAEIAGMSERPPSDAEMRLAKNALTRSLPLKFETSEQVGRRVARRLIYDLPDDYWERYRDRVEAVTREQVVQVSERYLARERLVLLAVGDAEAIAPQLEALDPVSIVDA